MTIVIRTLEEENFVEAEALHCRGHLRPAWTTRARLNSLLLQSLSHHRAQSNRRLSTIGRLIEAA